MHTQRIKILHVTHCDAIVSAVPHYVILNLIQGETCGGGGKRWGEKRGRGREEGDYSYEVERQGSVGIFLTSFQPRRS
jgi:hypothetical protein